MVTEFIKTIKHYNDSLLMNTLETNLKFWLDYQLLKIGAWNNVTLPTHDIYGHDLSSLRLVKDPAFPLNAVFESRRKDWVWESVVYQDKNGNNHSPISPAKVYVNSVLTTPNHINYPLGRVVFNSPITGNVTAEYSYRLIQVYVANDVPWWRELQFRIFRDKDTQFTESDKGFWSIGSQHRIQMPAILLEASPNVSVSPYEIGSGASRVIQEVNFYVFAENKFDRNNITDILRGQFDNNIVTFDPNLISNNDYPLKGNGDINDSSKDYQFLVQNYRYLLFRVERVDVREMVLINPRLWTSVVQWSCEFVIG